MGSKGGGPDYGAIAMAQEQARQDRIRQGTQQINDTFGKFNNQFFTDRRNDFANYQTPQLEDQYADALRELTYSLARSGNLNSSARAEKTGELTKLYDLNKQKIADDALSAETAARNSVEDARANLITSLNATGDATGAANAASNRSAALSQPATYSPLEQVFLSFTNSLGTQAAQERAAAASGGSFTPRYNTGLFGNTGRVSVSR